jgi:hypothetical protein
MNRDYFWVGKKALKLFLYTVQFTVTTLFSGYSGKNRRISTPFSRCVVVIAVRTDRFVPLSVAVSWL